MQAESRNATLIDSETESHTDGRKHINGLMDKKTDRQVDRRTVRRVRFQKSPKKAQKSREMRL